MLGKQAQQTCTAVRKSTGPGVRINSLIARAVTFQPFDSMKFCFLICKIRTVISITSQDFYDDKVRSYIGSEVIQRKLILLLKYFG